MDKPKDPDQRVIRILRHPLRVQILQILERQDASPTRLSKFTKEPLAKILYHVKVLVKEDCIELNRMEPRRGTAEHFYRLKPQGLIGAVKNWGEVPASLQGQLVTAALESFTTHAISALKKGTFQERDGSVLNWRPMRVDEDGWNEILLALQDADNRLSSISLRGAERLGEKDGIAVVVSFSAFEAASPPEATDNG
jgi:DNA-binding transcriptional ArsR family regulator